MQNGDARSDAPKAHHAIVVRMGVHVAWKVMFGEPGEISQLRQNWRREEEECGVGEEALGREEKGWRLTSPSTFKQYSGGICAAAPTASARIAEARISGGVCFFRSFRS